MNSVPGQSYSTAAPSYFDPESVGIATFLATPVAGGVLQAINYWVAGSRGDSAFAVVLGGVATAILMAIGAALPRALWMFGSLLSVFVVFIARYMVRGWIESNRIDDAVRYQQARFRSRGLVALACAPVTVALMGWLIAASVQEPQDRPAQSSLEYRTLSINARSDVFYGRGVTEAEARTLGDALLRAQYFGTTADRNIRVERNASGLRVTVPTVDNASPEGVRQLIQLFRVAVASIEPTQPSQIALADVQWRERATQTLLPLRSVQVPDRSRLLVGHTVSDSDALEVARYLQEEQYFVVGRENTAAFERIEEVPTLVFLIPRAAVTNEALRESQMMAHRLAARLHLLRAQVQLVDDSLAVHQTFVGDPQQAQPLAPSTR